MLDLKIWIDEIDCERKVLYEHYEKKMTTKAVIHADSAIPTKTKRTVLTQEMLRIMLHCSRYIPTETVNNHLNNFMKKMQYSGYKKTFRYDVAKSASHAYRTIQRNEERGIRPVNRPKDWQREERREQNQKKKMKWYKQGGFHSVLFIPTTPDGKLKQMYENVIRESGIRIKVVERTGRTLKSQLQTSNPFRQKECGRQDCFICTTTKKGNCNTEGITYKIECEEPNCNKVYKGETSNNAYTRGKQHQEVLGVKNAVNSPLWGHCVAEHGGEMKKFSMTVTGTFRNDAMLRQIAEAVQINSTNHNGLMNDRAEWNMTRIPRTEVSHS